MARGTKAAVAAKRTPPVTFPPAEPPLQLVETDLPLKYISVNPAFRPIIGKIPASALSVPSMMSVAEKRMLYGLAERYYQGEGIIVDAGIFLGASTRCFGEGLMANPRLEAAKALKTKPIVSFEKGDINPGMPPFFKRNKVDFDGPVGGSFLPILQTFVEPVDSVVDLRIGDVTQDTQSLDYPIEICFLDVLKFPEISAHCLQRYFPRLIPGRSIVLQQDYFYERLPYIKTHQEYLRDHFEFIGEVGSTAVFRCISPIPAEKLDALLTIEPEEQLSLASVALQRSKDPARRLLMALSKIRLVVKLHGKAEAARQLALVRAEYPDQVHASPSKRMIEALEEIDVFCGR